MVLKGTLLERKNFGDEYFADLDMIEVVEASKRISIESDDSDEGINLNESSDNDDLAFKTPGELTAIKKHSQRKSQRRKTAKKPQPTKVEEKPEEVWSQCMESATLWMLSRRETLEDI